MAETDSSLPDDAQGELPSDEASWEFLIHETAAIVKREIDERHAIGKHITKGLREARDQLAEEESHLANPEYPRSIKEVMDLATQVIIPYNPDGHRRSSRLNNFGNKPDSDPTGLN